MRFSILKAFASSVFIALFSFSSITVAQQGMGVGNNNPLEMLDVSGAIKIGTTSNVPPGGAGTIRWNGTDFEGWDGTQWITFAAASDGDWTVSGSNVYNTTSNVGMGTNAPNAKLHVELANGDFKLFNNAGNAGVVLLGRLQGNNNLFPQFRISGGGAGGDIDVGKDANGSFVIERNDVARLVIKDDGNVGIGTSTPNAKMEVSGDLRVTDKISLGNFNNINASTNTLTFTIDGTGGAEALLIADGVSHANTAFKVGSNVLFRSNGNSYLNSGNFGLGLLTPAEKLHVIGSIRMVDGNQAAGKVLVSDVNGTASWSNAASMNILQDADTDTKIQVEETADEDKIRFDIAGSEKLVISANASGNTLIETPHGLDANLAIGFEAGLVNASEANTFVGNQSGKANTTGGWNTFLGDSTGSMNTTGQTNTFIGKNAGLNNTTSWLNTVVGGYAGQSITTGGNNTMIGAVAGSSVTGNGNTMLGMYAGKNATTVSKNVYLGQSAGKDATGSSNVFVGWKAGFSETGSNKLFIENSNSTSPLIYGEFDNDLVKINGQLSASVGFTDDDGDTKIQVEESADEDIIRFDVAGAEQWSMVDNRIENTDNSLYIGNDAGLADNLGTGSLNTAIGNRALESNTANGSTAVGYAALQNANAGGNTAVGKASLFSTTTGNLNTAVGQDAGFSNTDGAENVFIGQTAMSSNVTGSNNVAIGRNAGRNGGSRSGNVYIGYSAGHGATGDNKLYIENSSASSPLIYGEFDTDIVGINGKLGVGTILPNQELHVHDATAAHSFMRFSHTGSGSNSTDGFQVGLNTSNEARLIQKENASMDFLTNNSERMTIDAGGNVGIGTAAPADRLEVNGSIRMVDGNQASGYIPVSDVNGTMVWTDPMTVSTEVVDKIVDADNDTKIQVEESADEDIIRFDVAGNEKWLMTGNRLEPTNGNNGVYIGGGAGQAETALSTRRSVFVGKNAGDANVSGINNVAVGYNAQTNRTAGNANVSVGNKSLEANVSGANNTAIGHLAGASTLGSGNVYIGQGAGQNATGSNKLYIHNSNTSSPLIYGDFNNDIVGINGDLGVGINSPAWNMHLHESSSNSALLLFTNSTTGTTDDDGLFVGIVSTEDAKIKNQENEDLVFGTNDIDRVWIKNDGDVGIGTSSPDWLLHIEDDQHGSNNFIAKIENTDNDNSANSEGLLIVAGHSTYESANKSNLIRFNKPNGNNMGRIRQDGGFSLQLVAASDKRLKENIIPTSYGLSEVMRIEVKDYNYIGDNATDIQTGFLAQDIYEVFPGVVDVGGEDAKTDPWGVAYGKLTPLLVQAIQDLANEKNSLETQVTEQSVLIQQLLERVQLLEQE